MHRPNIRVEKLLACERRGRFRGLGGDHRGEKKIEKVFPGPTVRLVTGWIGLARSLEREDERHHRQLMEAGSPSHSSPGDPRRGPENALVSLHASSFSTRISVDACQHLRPAIFSGFKGRGAS